MLGRRVSAGGRTSAFVAGRAATAADLKLLGGRLLAFFGQHEHRKLTIASAQLEILDGFVGAEHLQTRAALPRGAPRVPAACRRSWRRCARREGSRERDLDLYRYELAEIEEVARTPRSGRRWPPSASACATPRACAKPRPRRTRGWPGPRRTAAARPRPGPGGSAAAGRRGLDPGLDAIAARVSGLAVELGDVGSELRDYAEGWRRTRRRWWRWRSGGGDRQARAQARRQRRGGAAHAERCRAEIARLEGAEGRGAEAEAALAAAEQRRASWARRSAPGAGGGRAAARSGSRPSSSGSRWPAPRSRWCSSRTPRATASTARETVELRVAPDPGDRAGAAARRSLRRRALAGDAGAERARPGRQRRAPWSSTRSTPASAATRRGGRRAAAGRSGRAARSSASPTCRRSPRSPTSTSGSRRTSPATLWPRSSASAARPWSPRSAACSAASGSDEAATATPASCLPPPEHASALRHL